MPVAMMHIRKMRVAMLDRAVHMHMAVRLIGGPIKRMFMLMMFVMHMPVPVFRGFVLMFMGVAFGQVQPHAYRH